MFLFFLLDFMITSTFNINVWNEYGLVWCPLTDPDKYIERRTRLDERHCSYSKKGSLYCYCLSWQSNREAAVNPTVACLSIWLCYQWDFFHIWSLIIAEVAEWSHREWSDKQVSEVGTGAAALLLHSCHWYTVGRQLEWAYVVRWHTKSKRDRTHSYTQLSFLYKQNKCVNYSLRLGKIHLLFHYISDISLLCVYEWALARDRGNWSRKRGFSQRYQGTSVGMNHHYSLLGPLWVNVEGKKDKIIKKGAKFKSNWRANVKWEMTQSNWENLSWKTGQEWYLHKTKSDRGKERERRRKWGWRWREDRICKTDELSAAGFVILANLISIICFLHI